MGSLSLHSRQIPDIEYHIAKLEEFEQHYTPVKLDFEKIVGTEIWEQHWENCQKHSDKIKWLIRDSTKN